jgi:hypothetical protein
LGGDVQVNESVKSEAAGLDDRNHYQGLCVGGMKLGAVRAGDGDPRLRL